MYLGADEELVLVEDDGQDGSLADEAGLRLLEITEALGHIGFLGRQSEEAVVFGVAPVGLVEFVAGDEHFKEGVRVVIVADPGSTAEVEFAFAHGGQVDLPLEVA